MSKKILWIDDEWTSLPEQVDRLKEAQIDVDCAASLEEGMTKFHENRYDAVLLDCIIPREDVPRSVATHPKAETPFLGLEFIDRVARVAAKDRPPILVLTIASDEGLLQKLNMWQKKGVVVDWMKKLSLEFSDVVRAVATAIDMPLDEPEASQTQEGIG